MPCCAIATCKNENRKTKGQSVIYHNFPKDPKIRKIWLTKCRRGDKTNIAHSRVCSEHFIADDYIRDLPSELLGLPPRRRLKETAIPSQKLPYSSLSATCFQAFSHLSAAHNEEKDSVSGLNCPSDTVPSDCVQSNYSNSKIKATEERKARQHKREVLKRALDFNGTPLIHPSLRKKKKTKLDLEAPSSSPPPPPLTVKIDRASSPFKDETLETLTNEKNTLEESVKQLRSKIVLLTSALQRQRERSKFGIESLRKRIRKLKEDQKEKKKKQIEFIYRVFGRSFTKNQINCYLLGKSRPKEWSPDDFARALSVRAVSSKFYSFLRKRMRIPLPGLTSLRQWIEAHDDESRVAEDVLQSYEVESV